MMLNLGERIISVSQHLTLVSVSFENLRITQDKLGDLHAFHICFNDCFDDELIAVKWQEVNLRDIDRPPSYFAVVDRDT